jgi:hypothetical protein
VALRARPTKLSQATLNEDAADGRLELDARTLHNWEPVMSLAMLFDRHPALGEDVTFEPLPDRAATASPTDAAA